MPLRFALFFATLLFVSACRSAAPLTLPEPVAVTRLTPAEADARAEVVRQDPVGYLERVAERCRTLHEYTLTFIRQERRGFLPRLGPAEHIQCWFRREPFSVRMKWLDTDIKYGESAYVEGERENKVRFVTRWWAPPLLPPPAVNRVDLETPVVWGEAKRPMTDFGLERLMDRTLDSLRRAGADVVVRYEGLRELPGSDATVHHIHIEYPAAKFPVPIQELYIDAETDLPTGTLLKYPAGDIDAAYFYRDIRTHVRLTDTDFLLEAERAAASPTGGSPGPPSR